MHTAPQPLRIEHEGCDCSEHCLAFALSLTAPAQAERSYGPGVTDTEFKIGQTMPYSGPVSALNVAGRAQAAYLRMKNGSFFDAVPAGADAYFMKHIIHDWTDADCLRILRSCRAAMPDRAKLLICEKVIPPGNDPHHGKLLDLIMLALTHGGCERTGQEYRDLHARAGFRLSRIVPGKADNSIIEAVKA